jgi:urease accessory protein UreH
MKAVAPTNPATPPKRERIRANIVANPNTSAAITTQPSARIGSTDQGTRLAR